MKLKTSNEQAGSHPCAACRGDGGTFRHAYGKPGCNCPDCGGPRCPVCLGSGRISDRMPARDSLADALTIRVNEPLWWKEYDIVQPFAFGGPPSTWSEQISYDVGRANARAAFRAVPGLRG